MMNKSLPRSHTRKVVNKNQDYSVKVYLDFFYIRTSFRNMNYYYRDEFSKFFNQYTDDKKAVGSYRKCYM